LDFSGHGEHKLSVEHVADPACFQDEAERVVGMIEGDPAMEAAARTGRLVLIFPGMSTLALTLCALFHGKYGYFPRIRWYVQDRETGAFNISHKLLDLQKIRNTARKEYRR